MSASSLNSMILVVALGKFVYDMTGRELDLGFLGLAEFLPSAMLVLVTGSIADRFDTRRIAAFAIGAEAVFAGAIAIYASSGPTALWPIILLVTGFGTARAFAAPATRSMPPLLAGEEMTERIVPLTSLAWQATIIVGPVIAGFTYLIKPWVPFVIAAAVATMAALMCLRLRFHSEPERSERPTVSSAVEGLRFVRRTPILLGAIALDLFAVLFGGAVALLPAIAEKRLHVDAGGLGLLRAAGGVGAVLSAAVLSVRPLRDHIGRILFVVVAIFGAATIWLGVTRSFGMALAAMFVMNAADSVSVFIRGTLVPLATPANMRGRVLAVEQVFIGASNELGAFESGVAARAFGTVGAVVSGGAATIVIAALFWVAFPALRRVRRFSDVSSTTRDVSPTASDVSPTVSS